jgi:EAL domain-containing protein (putative c-di-GMP-specific phosphodiesterase class I)
LLACLAGGTGLLACFALLASGLGGDHGRAWLTGVLNLPVNLLAVALALRASRHRSLDRRTRLAWRVLAASFACQPLANAAWWWPQALAGGSPPFAPLAAVGCLAVVPPLLAGLLAFPGRPASGAHGHEPDGQPADEDRQGRRAQLETDLRLALEREELAVNYQPIVTLHDGRIVGVEALLRWRHPRHGMVPPTEFIPLAEATGLIQELGSWVLQEAGRQVRAWQERFPRARPLQLSVNLSPRQVQDPHLVQDVTEILGRIGLDPRTLVLELTEGVLVRDTDEAVAKLAALKQLGIRIAIDDFGTGYSSLGYLTHLPVDILKIDRCFIAELGTGSEGSVVAEAMVRLSQALHLDTVAEGIEAAEQAAGLRELGCPLGQGYYFAHPLSGTAFETLLEQGGTAAAASRPGQPRSTVRSP